MEEILSSIKRVIQEGADGIRGRNDEERPLSSSSAGMDGQDDPNEARHASSEVLELTESVDGDGDARPIVPADDAYLDVPAPVQRLIDPEPELSSPVPLPRAVEADGPDTPTRREPAATVPPADDQSPPSDRTAVPDAVAERSGDLLSSAAAAAGRQSFATLSRLVVRDAGGDVTLEALVRDMLRPMLSDWLDTNLPGIVERQVAAEVRRISTPDVD